MGTNCKHKTELSALVVSLGVFQKCLHGDITNCCLTEKAHHSKHGNSFLITGEGSGWAGIIQTLRCTNSPKYKLSPYSSSNFPPSGSVPRQCVRPCLQCPGLKTPGRCLWDVDLFLLLQLYSAMTFLEKKENYIHPKILRSWRGVSILKCPLAPSAGSKSHYGPV